MSDDSPQHSTRSDRLDGESHSINVKYIVISNEINT